MLSNLFPLVRDYAPATALLGSNPVRFFPHGAAPQGVGVPYATQMQVDGVPENALNGRPLADATRVQVSVWDTDETRCEQAARAMRDAFEAVHDVLTIRGMGKDFDTQRFRVDLDVLVWHHRANESSTST